MLTERLCHGEIDASLADGVVLHEVELTVRVGSVVIVQTVEVHGLQQGGALQLLFGQVGDIDTAGVALVLDVQLEFLLRNAGGSQAIYVLHHQSPCGQTGTAAGRFQQFHVEGRCVVSQVAAELTHLVGHATVSVFVGNTQYVVGLQGGVQ